MAAPGALVPAAPVPDDDLIASEEDLVAFQRYVF
jgi:hypothetical protein